jgi:hypothetical protein
LRVSITFPYVSGKASLVGVVTSGSSNKPGTGDSIEGIGTSSGRESGEDAGILGESRIED